MALHEQWKMVHSGLEILSHRILNDVTSSISAELLERAHMEMPDPSGKSMKSGQISVKLVFQGQMSERDQSAARDVMQAISNPAELIYIMKKHSGK